MCLSCENWRPTEEEAIALQRGLEPFVRIHPLEVPPKKIAGADVAYLPHDQACFAAIVVLDGIAGEVLDQAVVKDPVPFSYVSGLLAFREAPPLVHAFSCLATLPDLVFVDGHGILHPRGVGLASHMGILLDIPTIGCAKGPPLGKRGVAESPAGKRGSYDPVCLAGNQPAGVVLCTRDLHKPVYVSPGHGITLEESIDWVLQATGRYRIPEPIRQAHQLACRSRTQAESLPSCPRPKRSIFKHLGDVL